MTRPWFEDGFPVHQPRLPADGIRAVSRRGAIATTWWSKRFLAAIESPETSSRLSRGRSYARSGQVLALTIAPGLVRAQVQGSRPQPYEVELSVPILRAKDWDAIVAALSEQAAYSAALLAGQLPESVEDVFEQLDLSLFPTGRQLDIGCSCPDWGNPCKHAAAVCYLLAEQFDDDPFAILAWRGMAQDALLAGIRSRRQRVASHDQQIVLPAAADDEAVLLSFWDGGDLPRLSPVNGDAVAGQVLRRLGPTGIVVRGSDLAELLLPAYEAMALPGHPNDTIHRYQ